MLLNCGLLNFFQSDSRIQTGVPYLAALSLSVIELIDTIGVCPIVVGTGFDMTTLLISWSAMKCVDCTVVSSISTSQFLLFFKQPFTVSVFSKEASARIAQSGKNVFVLLPHMLEALFLTSVPSWSLLHCQADEFIHRQYNVFTPSYVLDFLAFVPYTLTACLSAANMLQVESPDVAVPLHSASGTPTSEAPNFQAVCAFLLSALEVIKWDHLNHSSPGPLDVATFSWWG